MFYQLQSCTNLENLISKKEKVPSMAKNLSVTTSISDLENDISEQIQVASSFGSDSETCQYDSGNAKK